MPHVFPVSASGCTVGIATVRRDLVSNASIIFGRRVQQRAPQQCFYGLDISWSKAFLRRNRKRYSAGKVWFEIKTLIRTNHAYKLLKSRDLHVVQQESRLPSASIASLHRGPCRHLAFALGRVTLTGFLWLAEMGKGCSPLPYSRSTASWQMPDYSTTLDWREAIQEPRSLRGGGSL
jgi:hypothetical protein